ncbi:Tat pathway signal sequence domain protein [Yinghuangia sp. ASG 101]|uniref:PKD domain-containing protein n=1 Tax=Yinghuangia sp. ASG 101 TaxID=2896848 RepID=UPI001E4E7BC6|nr:Tat pathway signal sequence domain protein [Yinghuangia sp. ASG 101]UGQ10994.1 Tat pathway signal sequence domain protein [Yinghuangia sp. ASG 101]
MSTRRAIEDEMRPAETEGEWSRRRFVQSVAGGAVVLLGASLMSPTGASAAASLPQCTSPQPGGPVWVTPDCVDPSYAAPVIDSQTDLNTPVPHRKISGHFEGTDKKFTIYLPPKHQWQGRFFQTVYPLTDENASGDNIAFGAASGAYTVQTNSGGGYQVDAAAAKFSRKVAAEYYGSSRRIYGYICGGSGGSFQTVAAMENSVGVWDGAVPFIIGSPVAIPNFFFARAFARLALESKAEQIADAMRPGGSGNPYRRLNDLERVVLREVTGMGVPLRGWQNPDYLLGKQNPTWLLDFGSVVRLMDPTYADDFWSRPGYLGTERSALGDLYRATKIDHAAAITRIARDAQGTPTSLVLDSAPANPRGTPLDFAVGRGGTAIGPLTGTLDPAANVFTIGAGNAPEEVEAITVGDHLRTDNRWWLALCSYHRHQVPARPGFSVWDQFRGADGQPRYPQRPVEIGPQISASVSGGGTFTGKVTGKVIVVANVLDVDAYPWDADWYRAQAAQAVGTSYEDSVQVWYNDNADHIGAHLPGVVDYGGILQQALRDVSAWAERGVRPPRPSRYSVTDGQISLPADADRRGGVQPVVNLTVNGRDRVDVAVGRSVVFRARVEVPARAGRIVTAAWDFTGSGEPTPATFDASRAKVEISATFTYREPGTYFPVLQVAASRDGDTTTGFALARNLARVRVVVR